MSTITPPPHAKNGVFEKEEFEVIDVAQKNALLYCLYARKIENLQRRSCLDVQSKMFDGVKQMSDLLKDYVLKSLVQKGIEKLNSEKVCYRMISVVESFPLLIRMWNKCENFGDVYASLLSAYKFFTGGSYMLASFDLGVWIHDLLLKMTTGQESSTKHWTHIPFVVQSGLLSDEEDDEEDSQFDWVLKGIRAVLDNVTTSRSGMLAQKIKQLVCHFITMGVFVEEKCEWVWELLDVGEFEKKSPKKQTRGGIVSFVLDVVETAVWFLERGAQALHLGTFDPFLHNEKSFTKWVSKAFELRTQAKMLSAPKEVSGIDDHKFLNDLKKCIERGTSMVKWSLKGEEKTKISALLSELRIIQNDVLTIGLARKTRQAPYCLLIAGDSSVGKSSFKNACIYHYAQVMNKPCSDEFVYTRTPQDKFYSGFSSSAWCVVMDDVAMQATSLNVVDPSIADILQIANNVPFTPPMADLEDKGKCPMRPDFVIATTNTPELNAHAYFSCPLAVRRRFPWVVTVEPKTQYKDKDTGMLDSKSIPLIEDGEYPNLWQIHVQQVVAVSVPNVLCSNPALEEVAIFEDINEFFDWMTISIDTFHEAQLRCQASDEKMKSISYCKMCRRTQRRCTCPMLQSGSISSDSSHEGQFSKEEDDVWYMNFGYTHTYVVNHCNACVIAELENIVEGRMHGAISDKFIRDVVADIPEDDDEIPIYMMNDYNEDENSLYEDVLHGIGYVSTVAQCYALNLKDRLKNVSAYVAHQAGALMWKYQFEVAKEYFRDLGKKVQNLWSTSTVAIIALGLSAVAIALKSIDMIRNMFGKSLQTGTRPTPPVQPEKKNEWSRENFVLSRFQLGSKSRGWNSMEQGEVSQLISSSTVNLRCEFVENGSTKFIPSVGIFVKGQILMTDNHCVPTVDFKCYMVEQCAPGQLNANVAVPVSQTEVFRIPEKDLAFFRVFMAPKKDLTGLFCREDVQLKTKGKYLYRDVRGVATQYDVENLQCEVFDVPAPVNARVPSWAGSVEIPTEFGMCGMPLLARTAYGPVLLGLHEMGAGNVTTAIRVLSSDIDAALSHYEPQVVAGTPNLQTLPGPLDRHSVFNYFGEEANGKVYGSTRSFRQCPRSRVTETFISEAAQAEGFVKRCVRPPMKGWEPWRNGIKETLVMEYQLDSATLQTCADCYADDVLSQLSQEDLKELIVLDDKTAINGFPGIRFLDKMNRNTSMGYPWNKSKRSFLVDTESEGIWNDPKMFTPEVMNEAHRVEECYLRGERAFPVFTASLKDEPLPEKKAMIKKIRIFMGMSGPAALIIRKYLMTFIRLFQTHPFLFEGAPGINCASKTWGKFREYLTEFGVDRMIAGDYGKFDKRMEALVIQMVFYIICRVLKAAGWSEQDLMVVRCIAADIAFALVMFQGDLIELIGSNPSGQPLTVIVNCIANSLYMRMCYLELNPVAHECHSFKENVHLITYGDDNAFGSKPEWFNHTAIQAVLASYGIVYTMADKEAESVPFIHIDDISFLKRHWRWSEDTQAWMCPLDWESIDKMLTMCVASDALCPEQQSVEAMECAMSEAFHYGRSKFEETQQKMQRIVSKCKLENYVAPTTFIPYDVRVEKYVRDNGEVGNMDSCSSMGANTVKKIQLDTIDLHPECWHGVTA